MNLGQIDIAGEFRCIITKADGSVKSDTGFQKNLILNQGLDFFGGGKGNNFNEFCVIGSGNSNPTISQTVLDSVVAVARFTTSTSNISYVDTGDSYYKIWQERRYRFTGLNNVNISELGLASQSTTTTDYYLTTRALIKDTLEQPTTITVLLGETLDIYYKIHKVVDIRDKAFVVNMLDGKGGSVPYNVVVRPAMVGGDMWGSGINTPIVTSNVYGAFGPSNIAAITTVPINPEPINNLMALSAYTPLSFKRVITINLGLDNANVAIRNMTYAYYSGFTFMPFQIRFGSVANDSPISKTNKETLSIPLEFSWGRYEGTL